MPPPPPRQDRPALARALPDDAEPGAERIPAGRDAMVMFADADATWRYCGVHGWRRDRLGRWQVQLEWYAGGGIFTGWFVYDARFVRPITEETLARLVQLERGHDRLRPDAGGIMKALSYVRRADGGQVIAACRWTRAC
jgi:hypothetical protein